MKHPIVISSFGKTWNGIGRKKASRGIRPSLPYRGIARRALNAPSTMYDREIDISAFLVNIGYWILRCK